MALQLNSLSSPTYKQQPYPRPIMILHFLFLSLLVKDTLNAINTWLKSTEVKTLLVALANSCCGQHFKELLFSHANSEQYF